MKQTVTLNVGFENNSTFENLFDAEEIANYMVARLSRRAYDTGYRDNTLVGVNIAQPGDTNATELTAVIQYSAEDVDEIRLASELKELSALLGQDAIAVLIDDDEGDAVSRGFLTGPKADAWGPFDPSRFEIGSANAGDWIFSDLP